MFVLSVVGARPQFIKAALVSRALREAGIREELVHTGQHFDRNMSGVFFDELEIPTPDVDLGVVESSHAAQTGKMMIGLEKVFLERRPSVVLVYGDTNSTLAAALAAVKVHIPVAHVEAGLRSFNRRMPEEINRIVTDQVSDLLFSTSDVATKHLLNEGIPKDKIIEAGDVMFDGILHFSKIAAKKGRSPAQIAGVEGPYVLATIHRAENTDDPERLAAIFGAFAEVARDLPVVLPLHPRTRKTLETHARLKSLTQGLTLLDPLGYLDMINLLKGAKVAATDSGGLQKEAYYLRVPCVTLRDETEWVETVQRGANRLVSPADGQAAIVKAIKESSAAGFRDAGSSALYGGGRAIPAIVESLRRVFT